MTAETIWLDFYANNKCLGDAVFRPRPLPPALNLYFQWPSGHDESEWPDQHNLRQRYITTEVINTLFVWATGGLGVDSYLDLPDYPYRLSWKRKAVQGCMKFSEKCVDNTTAIDYLSDRHDVSTFIQQKEASMYEVDKGVPVPEKNQRQSKVVEFLSSLSNGDSFVIPKAGRLATLRKRAKALGMEIRHQPTSDGQVRCWVVKAE